MVKKERKNKSMKEKEKERKTASKLARKWGVWGHQTPIVGDYPEMKSLGSVHKLGIPGGNSYIFHFQQL